MTLAPYYDHAGITIYHGDALEILPQLDPVDLVFTSPPYLNQRSYGLTDFDWYAAVPPALAGVNLTEAGQMLVNLGLKHDNGRVVRYWDVLIDACEAAGLRLFGWYVWDQGSGLPGDWRGRLAPSHEWVMHFCKESIRPRKCFRSKYSGSEGGTYNLRKGDATNQRRAKIIQSEKISDTVLRVTRDKGPSLGHPARFPVGLPMIILLSWQGLVLDPYMGSGTTLRAAKDLGRRAIGIEIVERYCEIAAKRLAQEVLPL